MLQGLSTTASTTRGALGRHTVSGTATATTPATSTPARARAVKQQVVALSSCEAEYIAISTASTQALWLVRLLSDLFGRDTGAVELRVDNKSALALAKNPIFHERSKHIWVRYHFHSRLLGGSELQGVLHQHKD
jgi:hypothetical protein